MPKILQHVVVITWDNKKKPYDHDKELADKLKRCITNIPSVKSFFCDKNIGRIYYLLFYIHLIYFFK
jgi:hypothetical protein